MFYSIRNLLWVMVIGMPDDEAFGDTNSRVRSFFSPGRGWMSGVVADGTGARSGKSRRPPSAVRRPPSGDGRGLRHSPGGSRLRARGGAGSQPPSVRVGSWPLRARLADCDDEERDEEAEDHDWPRAAGRGSRRRSEGPWSAIRYEAWKTLSNRTVAILDRLMHWAVVFNIKGPSWRMREHQALAEAVKA